MQQNYIWRQIYRFSSYPPFIIFFKWLDELIFSRDSAVDFYLKQTKPQLLIYPGSALDAYSHIVARTAERCKIPSLMIIAHWDFFSKKSLLRFRPNKIYVWGNDMKQMALHDNSINKNLIEIVGSPSLDHYVFRTNHDRVITLSSFDIDPTKKVILFAGTSVPYDEVSVLSRLNYFLKRNNIQNFYIIYRPHPRGWIRKSDCLENPTDMNFVKVDIPTSKYPASQSHYMNLLSAVDGIVSPFSTMILEGALCGKNVMCVSFADGINNFDFSITNTTDHLKSIKTMAWATICDKSENLELEFSKFIMKIESNDVSNESNTSIKDIIYYDEHPYSDRLLKRIQNDFFND